LISVLSAASTTHAQYADWNANPPKILPNERPGSGAAFLTGSGRQFPNRDAFAVLKSDGSVATWGNAQAGGNFSIADTIYNNGSYYGETTYTPVDGNISSNVRAVYSNGGAFAALKSDGSLVTWGYGPSGGRFSVSSHSDYPRGTIYTAASGNITSNVTAVYSTSAAFAALKSDGSVVTWGDAANGGDSTTVAAALASNVKAVYANTSAFAALKTDGSVVTWGDATTGGNSTAVAGSLASNVTAVYATEIAFAALKADGSVVTWGDAQFGGNSTAVAGNLTSNVTAVYSNQAAFAALKTDGSVVTWGYAELGGNSTAVASSLTSNVTAVYATQRAFAALKTNGSVVTWGDASIGGSSALVAHKLTSNVAAIYSTGGAFAALKTDGSVVTWGFAEAGGDSSAVADKLSSDVTTVYSTGEAFAAVKTDGSVATWGRSYDGGDSTAVAASLTSNVTAVYSNRYAFAALKSDGSVVAWGSSTLGGSGAPSGTGFTSVQSAFYIPSGALATGESSALTSTTATLLGEVVREGNSPVTARGFVYALASVTDPEIGDVGVTQVTDSGSGLGSYSKLLSGLTPNTAYVFRAYVINDEGTTYGSLEDFSTNLPPVIISDGGNTNVSLSVAENSTAVSTVSATDADPGQTITYSISGGADAARFSIGATSGVVTFSAAPDYEAPADANADNVYTVIVRATDNGNPPKSATQTLSVTVTNEIDNGVLAVEQPAGTSLASRGTANFGSLTIGQTTELTFTLRSQGEASLLMQSGAVISGAAASEYSLIGSVPVSLASDGNTTFTVRFSPTTSGNRLATLSIPTNDTRPGRSPYTITLSGTALATSTIATYANAANQVRGGWINGENFTIGAVGTTNPGNNWPSAEGPDKVVDSNTGSKFLIFRNSNAGLIFSPTNSNIVFNRLSLSTANDASERDPASYVIYGSSTLLTGTAGTNISLTDLTQLASGMITLPDNRTTGPTVVQFANTTAYASYIVAFPTVRSTSSNNLTQISEVQLSQGINPPVAVAMEGARGGQLSSGTFTFGSFGSTNPGTNWNANESPDQAIDGSVSTKYLLFRNTGVGLIASPQAGPARVNRLNFWTANDSAERDPLTYEVYGFSTAVTARSGTLNVSTSGTLLTSGTLTLPATRNIGSDTVVFDNSTAYASYLVVFPTVKNSPSTTMTQIAEVQFGYNGTPAFALSDATITVAEDSGSYSSNAFATDITPGIGDVGQTVSFAANNNNNALFSVRPAISADGTLTFTPAANANGSATVTVIATDSVGLSSASQNYSIVVTSVIDTPVLANTPTSASITTTTVTLGGEVTASEATVNERGVVYAITSANAAPQIGGTDVTKLSTSGTTGVFTVDVSDLAAGTGYSFRAYAINSAGTSYSEVGTFTTVSAPTHTDQELWRFANFGSYDSVDSGADSADPDGDGLNNLLEYVMGSDPNASDILPATLALNGPNLEYTYTRSTAAKDAGVTYQVLWSDTLEVGSWSAETVTEQITSTEGTLETVKATVPKGTGRKRFIRLQVTGPAQ
jgi:alpha-tubulin suppressor-like RCC1 family protein